MNAFAADISAATALFGGNFVDLIQENDTIFFDRMNGFPNNRVFVQQPISFFLDQRLVGFLDRRSHTLRPAFRRRCGNAVEKSLRGRDEIDSGRAVSPLTMVEGAVHLDTTAYTLEEVVDLVVGLVEAVETPA